MRLYILLKVGYEIRSQKPWIPKINQRLGLEKEASADAKKVLANWKPGIVWEFIIEKSAIHKLCVDKNDSVLWLLPLETLSWLKHSNIVLSVGSRKTGKDKERERPRKQTSSRRNGNKETNSRLYHTIIWQYICCINSVATLLNCLLTQIPK